MIMVPRPDHVALVGNALAVCVRMPRHGVYGAILLIAFTSSADG
jgi:hypothetical protein